ncbi:hypothetical protein ACWOFR_14970 [Carnobacterium gallinarum]|nr:hypothetical protein [Carnobacterium gallinarum]
MGHSNKKKQNHDHHKNKEPRRRRKLPGCLPIILIGLAIPAVTLFF